MENMDNGLTVSKLVLINRPKITQMPKICLPNLFAQAQKFGILMEKGFIGYNPMYRNKYVPLFCLWKYEKTPKIQDAQKKIH